MTYRGWCSAEAAAYPMLERRLELFTLILQPPPPLLAIEFPDHAQCEAFGGSVRGRLCQHMALLPPRRLEAGEHLYRTGSPSRSLFLVRSGLIKTSTVSSEGEELTLRLGKPGDLVGELCLCGGNRREDAVALEPSAVVEMSLPALLGRLRDDPDIAVEFAAAVCDRLADAYEQIESLSWDTVLYRLVRTLLRLAAELGEPTENGTSLAHHIKQEELARLVGARREVVSGLLNRLRASGHISYSARGAITVHPGSLHKFLAARSRAG
ncbi:MAG: Crp/Fnr family transcriptional regulator [Gemmatimonadales bacterium]